MHLPDPPRLLRELEQGAHVGIVGPDWLDHTGTSSFLSADFAALNTAWAGSLGWFRRGFVRRHRPRLHVRILRERRALARAPVGRA